MLRVLLLLATVAYAQSPQDTAKKKARELLDSAAELASAAKPDVHVIALMHAGEAYREFDEKRAALWLRQAFAATPSLEDETRAKLQTEVVKHLAAINVDDAAALLPSMTAPAEAAGRVIALMIEKSQFDRAIETLNLIPETVPYPFAAAQQIFEKLPKEDTSRRVIVFSKALAAFQREPTGAFPEMLAKHWREVPEQLAQSSLSATVSALRRLAEEEQQAEELEGPKGKVKLGSRQSIEFFRMAEPLRTLAPKLLDELMVHYPDLAAALKQFPNGRDSVEAYQASRTTQGKSGSSFSRNAGSESDSSDDPPLWGAIFGAVSDLLNPDMLKNMRETGELSEAALKKAKENPQQGLDAARRIKDPATRAELIARIAEIAAEKDAATAQQALASCIAQLGDLKPNGATLMAWVSAAAVAHKLKQDESAWDALRHAVEAVTVILSSDLKPDDPNVALREFWPSTQGARLLMNKAGSLMGPPAETLLVGIENPELALLARIELARALQGKAPDVTSMLVNRRKSE